MQAYQREWAGHRLRHAPEKKNPAEENIFKLTGTQHAHKLTKCIRHTQTHTHLFKKVQTSSIMSMFSKSRSSSCAADIVAVFDSGNGNDVAADLELLVPVTRNRRKPLAWEGPLAWRVSVEERSGVTSTSQWQWICFALL